MLRTRILHPAAAILLILASIGVAQTRPASPATGPATGPARKPLKVATPPGYVRLEGGQRAFICLAVDEPWVRKAASRAIAGTATTRPADMLKVAGEKREAVVAAMLRDLPTLKPSQVEKLIDEQIQPALKTGGSIKPSLVFIVSPAEHLKQALRDGWTDPHFRYNTVGDALEIDLTVSFSADGVSDESAVSAIFRPTDTEDDRVSQLAQYVTRTESDVLQSITSRTTSLAVIAVADFLSREVFKELPTGEDQVWLSVGLSNVLAARYVSMIHGSPLQEFIQALVVSPRNSPVDAGTIDLLNPTPSKSLKDEFVPAYLDARRRKAIAVMYYWLTESGDPKLLPMLEAVQRGRPADGATLAEIVKSSGGPDLAPLLRGR